MAGERKRVPRIVRGVVYGRGIGQSGPEYQEGAERDGERRPENDTRASRSIGIDIGGGDFDRKWTGSHINSSVAVNSIDHHRERKSAPPIQAPFGGFAMTLDGRSPGLRLSAGAPPSRRPPGGLQWIMERRLAAYSCGGSPGLGPAQAGPYRVPF